MSSSDQRTADFLHWFDLLQSNEAKGQALAYFKDNGELELMRKCFERWVKA
jgi:hypothetical protein